MKLIPLSQNKNAIVDNNDFYKLSKLKWCYDNGYAVRTDKKRKKVLMHRLILSTPKNMLSHHINGNGLDNRRSNLRIVTPAINQHNRKINKNNNSGFNGVHWCKSRNKWVSSIRINNKKKNLGRFNKLFDALKARQDAETTIRIIRET